MDRALKDLMRAGCSIADRDPYMESTVVHKDEAGNETREVRTLRAYSRVLSAPTCQKLTRCARCNHDATDDGSQVLKKYLKDRVILNTLDPRNVAPALPKGHVVKVTKDDLPAEDKDSGEAGDSMGDFVGNIAGDDY